MTKEAFWETYGKQLNTQQRQAVETTEGPVLLLAVPGSGKTTTLVTRLGYLILVRGIAPEHLLTLTYTVSAAGDMAERFAAIFGAELAGRLSFRTINGICAGIIASFGKQIGRRAYTLVTEDAAAMGLLRRIYTDVEEESPTEGDLQEVRTLISYVKNQMLEGEGIQALGEENNLNLSEIYRRYCEAMRSQKCMDYDDQMIYARMLLLKFPDLLSRFQARYPYLCVDEAQDTSRIQHEILHLLAGKERNLFLVGDEDQSIYGFRAACPEELLHFQERYPGGKVLLMETNFRSNEKIVAAADAFIQKNTLRHEKHMKAARPAGPEIKFLALRARGAQYTYLAKAAQTPKGKTAVLCRDNESLLPLIDLLQAQGTPFTLRRPDTSFFTSRTVTDIRNIMAYAKNPRDTELFRKIYYKLGTYLNKQAAAVLCEQAAKKGMSPFAAAKGSPALSTSVRTSMAKIGAKFRELPRCTAVEALNLVMGSMGYGSYLERAGIRQSKVPILYQLAGRAGDMEDFLERLSSLETYITERSNPRTDFILSTIHASKGLEYDTVYLIDAADGLFPQQMPEDPNHPTGAERSAYEEERRLFYVAVTRARDNLILFEFGKPAALLAQFKEAAGVLPPKNRERAYPRTVKPSPPTSKEVEERDASGYAAFAESLTVGLSVIHVRYGPGVIVRLEGPRIWIRFEEDAVRKFSLPVLYQKHLLVPE